MTPEQSGRPTKSLVYEISIRASREAVWDTLIGSETYPEWAKAFSAGSTYEGEWKQGTEMRFWDPNIGGTTALLKEVTPPERIVAHHIDTVTKDGVKETTGPMTEKWIGTTEIYELALAGDVTQLTVRIETHKAFAQMFEAGWPKALEKLKALAER